MQPESCRRAQDPFAQGLGPYRGNEALALAQRLSHPYSLAFAGHFVGDLRQYRREVRAAQDTAESMIAISAEHGLTDHFAL
jgi:hypothetical protein